MNTFITLIIFLFPFTLKAGTSNQIIINMEIRSITEIEVSETLIGFKLPEFDPVNEKRFQLTEVLHYSIIDNLDAKKKIIGYLDNPMPEGVRFLMQISDGDGGGISMGRIRLNTQPQDLLVNIPPRASNNVIVTYTMWVCGVMIPGDYNNAIHILIIDH